jgi:hypothetical protein
VDSKSSSDYGDDPAAAPSFASWGGLNQAQLVESKAQGAGTDEKHVREFEKVLVSLTPEALDDTLGHQHASGEIIGNAFGLLFRGLECPVVVKEVPRGVVEHVLELVHQAEALPKGWFVSVKSDHPVAAVPVCCSGDGEADLAYDADARQFADDLLGDGDRLDVEVVEETVGLEFCDPQGFAGR